jgi:hypothetical protein
MVNARVILFSGELVPAYGKDESQRGSQHFLKSFHQRAVCCSSKRGSKAELRTNAGDEARGDGRSWGMFSSYPPCGILV